MGYHKSENSNDQSPHYEHHMPVLGQPDIEVLRAYRAENAQHHQDMTALKKQFGRDPVAGRFFKEESRAALKRSRAADYWIKNLEGTIPLSWWKDSWPVELADELDAALAVATL